ncbi:MAG TPA: hypothetical protein O0X61_02930, partial [Methanocorpusculum sp.]|nr:hypothetical protein [Methanocorpusculum sp.]
MANVFDYPKEQLSVLIAETSAELLAASSAKDAVPVIKKALEKYTIFDLQRIGGNIRREVEVL